MVCKIRTPTYLLRIGFGYTKAVIFVKKIILLFNVQNQSGQLTCCDDELVTCVFKDWFWRDTRLPFFRFSMTDARLLALPLCFKLLFPSRENSGICNKQNKPS